MQQRKRGYNLIKLIAVVDKNFGLSKNGKIPWEFEEDRKLFRKLTLGSVVIMGRNTFFSHKNIPLKDRINCVITKRGIPEVICFSSVESAIEKYSNSWIIGGEEIYNYALEKNLVSAAIITQVQKNFEADKFLETNFLKNFSKKILILKKDYCIWRYKKSL